MSPADARTLVLAAEIERDLAQVERHAERSQRVSPEGGDPEAAYVALALDHAYQAFESLLVRVERSLGLPRREGAEWHREILREAALPIAGLRPAIIPEAAEQAWGELLGFRQFLRQAYSYDLDAQRLLVLRQHLHDAVAATVPRVTQFVEGLRRATTG